MLRALPIIVCLAISAPAHDASADKLTESPELGARLALSTRIKANLNDYSNDVAFQLSELTMGLLDMRFNLQRKHARFKMGGGDPESFRLHIDSDVLIGKGRARIQARLDLAIAGHRLELEVPDIDLDTESISGQRAVQLSLPLLEGQF